MINIRIRNLRKEKDITQRELGNIINVGATTINGYEKGIISPPQDKLIKLAEYFNVSVDYLVGKSSIRQEYVTDVVDVEREFKQLIDVLETQPTVLFRGEAIDNVIRRALIIQLTSLIDSTNVTIQGIPRDYST